MNVTFALLADAANQSREGKLNILGAFNTIYASSFPAQHPEMQLVMRLDASPAEAQQIKRLEIVFMDADGQEVNPSKIEAEFLVPKPEKAGRRVQMETVLRLVGTTFPKEGDYSVAILIDGDEKATIPLSIEQPPSPTAGA